MSYANKDECTCRVCQEARWHEQISADAIQRVVNDLDWIVTSLKDIDAIKFVITEIARYLKRLGNNTWKDSNIK